MEAIDFNQRNVLIAEDQDQFMTLPAYFSQPGDGYPRRVISKWKLSEEEIDQVMKTGEMYLCTITGGEPLQPISASISNPFDPKTSKFVPTNEEIVLISPDVLDSPNKYFEPIDWFKNLPNVGYIVPRLFFEKVVKIYKGMIADLAEKEKPIDPDDPDGVGSDFQKSKSS